MHKTFADGTVLLYTQMTTIILDVFCIKPYVTQIHFTTDEEA